MMREVLKDHLDKLLVMACMVASGMAVCWFVNAKVDKDAVTWAMRCYDNLQGSFITLLTGGVAKLAMGSRDKE
jgi:hypothetical protein